MLQSIGILPQLRYHQPLARHFPRSHHRAPVGLQSRYSTPDVAYISVEADTASEFMFEQCDWRSPARPRLLCSIRPLFVSGLGFDLQTL